MRYPITGDLLYQPYTQLEWDQHADALSDISANNVAKFGHIARFGRPLFVLLI